MGRWKQSNMVLIGEKKNAKSARHEKMLLIHTEIMLIKVWAEREVNNGSPLIDS